MDVTSPIVFFSCHWENEKQENNGDTHASIINVSLPTVMMQIWTVLCFFTKGESGFLSGLYCGRLHRFWMYIYWQRTSRFSDRSSTKKFMRKVKEEGYS